MSPCAVPTCPTNLSAMSAISALSALSAPHNAARTASIVQSRRDLGRFVTIADRNLPIFSSVLAVNETGMG